MSTEWESEEPTPAERDVREAGGGITWRGVVALLIVCVTVIALCYLGGPDSN